MKEFTQNEITVAIALSQARNNETIERFSRYNILLDLMPIGVALSAKEILKLVEQKMDSLERQEGETKWDFLCRRRLYYDITTQGVAKFAHAMEKIGAVSIHKAEYENGNFIEVTTSEWVHTDDFIGWKPITKKIEINGYNLYTRLI